MPELDSCTGYEPERRLWCAVMISAIDEYTEWLHRINVQWNSFNRPVNPDYKFSLKHIRRQCRSEWFQAVCEMADFSPDRIFAKFDALDREYCLHQILFADESERFMSQWALRKLAKQRVV